MSNSPTLPPPTGPHRKPTPLPSFALSTESDARLQAALAASARAEASLTGLSRAIAHLGSGVGGAREANESLTGELEGLRDMLGAANEQQLLFQVKIEQLELVLDRTRKEHERERTFLIGQQDTFLAQLLDQQALELKRRDTELEVLRARLAELERQQAVTVPPLAALPSVAPPSIQLVEPTPSVTAASELERAERAELERTAQKLAEDRERARETVSRLQVQRDEAQHAAARISKERDEALHLIHSLKAELGGPRIPLSTRPPASETGRDSAPESAPRASAPAPSPREPVISSVLSPPRSDPNAAPIPTRLSPPPPRPRPRLSSPGRESSPPEELRRALTTPAATQSTPTSRPPLKQKPDASTRPLVGYSLGNEFVEAEHLEGVRLSSKPGPSNGEKT